MRLHPFKAASLSVFCIACVTFVFAGASVKAEVLLLDPSTVSGTTTFSPTSLPYSVPTSSVWNRGNNGSYVTSGTLYYASGAAATGVTAVTDNLENLVVGSGTAIYNFNSPAVSASAGNVFGVVFATNPTNTGVAGTAASNVGYGGLATKVSGLAYGTYDIYVVTGYTGATAGSRPGGASPAQHNVWAFEGANFTTLQAGTYGTADTLLENSTNASWVLDNNYAKITVTLDATNPYLYVISQGFVNDSNRGWLDSVQIVSVPEPSSLALLGLSTGALFFGRRRQKQ
jgi:hypothetical protein